MEQEKPPFIDALEAEAYEQLDLIRQYRTSLKSNDPEARLRAKGAIGVIGAYVRLRATLANEKTNELVERRLSIGEVQPRRSLV